MIRGIDVLDNDDLVLTGFTDYAENGFVFIAGGSKGFIMKMDNQGETLWENPIAATQGAKVLKTAGRFLIYTTQFMNDPDTPQEM